MKGSDLKQQTKILLIYKTTKEDRVKEHRFRNTKKKLFPFCPLLKQSNSYTIERNNLSDF